MKTIKIKSLKLTNFKGIRSLQLNELSKQTHIYGDNGVGKTSIFDAFTWLLFGKDSTDRKSFEVQTLDSQNNIIPKIEAEVSAVLDVDGESIRLTRIMRQKWVKRKGALESEFTGNETVYEWNGVPMNAGEFTSKINNIIDEKIFKMITNPAAFNSLKWQDQRDVLIDMSGNITDEDVANGNPEFQLLLKSLTGKSFKERKAEVRANILKSKKEIESIPTRIDEVQRSKPEVRDFDKIGFLISQKEGDLKAINDQITDDLKAQQALIDKKSDIKKQIQEKDFKISDLKHAIKSKAKEEFRKQNSGKEDIQRQFNEKNSELTTATNALETLKSKLEAKKTELTQIANKIVGLRTEWETKNAEPINVEIDTCCPACKQELPYGDIEAKKVEINTKLSQQKQEALNSINERGLALKATQEATVKERDDLEVRIENGVKHIENINIKLTELEHDLKSDASGETRTEENIYADLFSKDTEIPVLVKEIETLTEQYDNIGGVNVEGFKTTREQITKELDELKVQLQDKDAIAKANFRITALSEEETKLGQTIADLEKELFTMEAFEKEKSTRIENSVNNKFKMVNFKLFETQINGGENPTCKALINGVPFSDANTASKINAGLDIINTLGEYYQVNAPIFIDNRESVVQLIDTDSQVINLVVSEADKKLRVLSMVEELETV